MINIDFFSFGKEEYEYFCEECMLNEKYKKLLKMKIQECSRQEIADELHLSIDMIDKMVAKLKKKIKKVL